LYNRINLHSILPNKRDQEGCRMDSNHLHRIVEAESRHDEIVRNAEETASQILEQNQEELKKYEASLQSGIEEMEKSILEEAAGKADSEANRLKETYHTEYTAIRDAASQRMDSAVEYIAERIVKDNWL
jgi:vacuolar-type H+-ATPase subunit H